MYQCTIMSDQLESRLKKIEDSVSGLQTAVNAMMINSDENTKRLKSDTHEIQSKDGDVLPNVSDDMKKHENVKEFIEYKEVEKQTEPNQCEDIDGETDIKEHEKVIVNEERSYSEQVEIQTESKQQNAENGPRSESKLISSINILNTSIRDLEGELRRFFAVIDEKVRQKRQCYVNWGKEHQKLSVGVYVIREEVQDAFEKINSISNYDGLAIQYEMLRLLRSFKTHKVDKYSRFPPHGVYVNIGEKRLYETMQEWIVTVNRAVKEERRVWIDIEGAGIDRVSKRVGDEDTENLLFDVDNFEAKYKLEWDVEL